MKPKMLALFILISYAHIVLAQDEKNGFSDIRFSYILSSISAGENFFKNDDTKIPYGIGIETTYNLNKRLNLSIGVSFKTTGLLTIDGFRIGEFGGYSGPIHIELRRHYFDIPLHLHYAILDHRSFEVSLIAGFKESFIKIVSENAPDNNGIYGHTKVNWSGTSYDMGIAEGLRLTDRFGLIASQVCGYYFIGNIKPVLVIDLQFGLKYVLK